MGSGQPRIPHTGTFTFGERTFEAAEVIERLEPYVSENRQKRIAEVVAGRTYTVVPVVEGLYDLGNVSAVMRSAEGLGFQAFHVIESGERFKSSNRVAQGADKWLDVSCWPDPVACATALKRQGYRLAATHLEAAVPLSDLDFTHPTALVFGNEAEGVSDELLALSDVRCIIPMSGFVQSFNISVAAAISLYHVVQDRIRRQGVHGDLEAAEREILRAVFYLRSVRHHAEILNRLS